MGSSSASRTTAIRTVRVRLRRTGRRLGCAGLALGAALGAALAQPLPHRPQTVLEAMHRAEEARRWTAVPGGLAIVEMPPAGPNQRPRHALRLPFEGATRAMRSLGVEAEECSSLLRPSTRMQASVPGGPERLRLSLSLAVSCRFF